MAQPQTLPLQGRTLSLEKSQPSPCADAEFFERAIAQMPNGDELVIDIYTDRVHLHGHRVDVSGGAQLMMMPGSCSVTVTALGRDS